MAGLRFIAEELAALCVGISNPFIEAARIEVVPKS